MESKTNKDDLLEMIQYGADKIFKSKATTDELKNKWQQHTKKNFSELTLEFNYQEYDGEDYTERRKERIKRLNEEKYALIASMKTQMNGKSARHFKLGQMGKERKNYNEDAYYR